MKVADAIERAAKDLLSFPDVLSLDPFAGLTLFDDVFGTLFLFEGFLKYATRRDRTLIS